MVLNNLLDAESKNFAHLLFNVQKFFTIKKADNKPRDNFCLFHQPVRKNENIIFWYASVEITRSFLRM